jgi:hypothetical protein
MGEVHPFPFPHTPECPPHDWIAIYDESVDGGDDEVITGRVCVKCSLIESRASLALYKDAILGGKRSVGDKRGTGQGSSTLWIIPRFG